MGQAGSGRARAPKRRLYPGGARGTQSAAPGGPGAARRARDIVKSRGLVCVTNTGVSAGCCTEDASRPPKAGRQGQAANRPVLRRSKGVVVSDRGKVPIKGDR